MGHPNLDMVKAMDKIISNMITAKLTNLVEGTTKESALSDWIATTNTAVHIVLSSDMESFNVES